MNGKLFKVNVISQGGLLFDGEAAIVIAPGEAGELGILADHIPLLSTLKQGRLKIESGTDATGFDIKGGFIEVDKDRATLLISPKEE